MGGLTFYPTKDSQILRNWREHKQNMAKLKDTVFKLLAHPETTEEMISVAREIAMNTRKREVAMLNKLRAAGYNVDNCD